LFAAKNRLDNLTLIVDHNGLQHDSSLEEIMPMGDVCKKFEAFGWDVVQADGHDFSSILEALKPSDRGLPRAVIAKTVKGKGVSFMENVVTWHHGCLNGANEENFRQALRELGEEA